MSTVQNPDHQRKGGTDGQGNAIVAGEPSDPRLASEAYMRMEYRRVLRYVLIGASDPFRMFSTYEVVREIAFRGLPVKPILLDETMEHATRTFMIVRKGIDIYAPMRK